MQHVIYVPGAIRDLQRISEFLRTKNPVAASRTVTTIMKSVHVLELHPQIGKPVEDMPDDYREWKIDFGDSGYVARYRFEGEAVTILTVLHQKEIGY